MVCATEMTTLEAMLVQDEWHYRTEDYLSMRDDMAVNASMRKTMIDWFFVVQQHQQYPAEVVEFAVSIVDRYFLTPQGAPLLRCNKKNDNKDDPQAQEAKAARNCVKEFQLVCMMAFFVAVKVQLSGDICLNFLLYLGKGNYTKEQMEDMESKILTAIDWRVNPPTSIALIQELVALIPSHYATDAHKDDLYANAVDQAERALFEPEFLPATKGTIAMAAVANAMDGFKIPPAILLSRLLDSNLLSSDHLSYQWVSYFPHVQQSLSLLVPGAFSPIFDDPQEKVQANTEKDNLRCAQSPVTVVVSDEDRLST